MICYQQKKGEKPSHAWKSLLEGRDLLKKGLMFVVGNGKGIKVWSDPWLNDHLPRPPKSKNPYPESIMVSDLMDVTGESWNVSLVHHLIAAEDVEKVLRIKLSNAADIDLLGWKYNADGLYSVRSGYWLATHLPGQDVEPPPPGNLQLKTKVWKIKSSPKIQHFIWKLLTGILPTGGNLRRRHISPDSVCKRCWLEEEDLNHLFFKCNYSKALWRASGISNTTLYDDNASVESKIEVILDYNLDTRLSSNSQLPIWILWRIWKSRNILLYQRRHISWETSLNLAKLDAKEWKAVEEFHRDQPNNQNSPEFRYSGTPWQRPNIGMVKCNYDATFKNRDTLATAGWIIRDNCGIYLGSAQAKGMRVNSCLEAELQALVMAMQYCWTKGYTRVCFEGDNQAVQDLYRGVKQHFETFNWIRVIRRWALKFEDMQVQWNRRSSNIPADLLAKKAV